MDRGKLDTGHRVNFITFFFYRSGYQNAPQVSDGCWNLLVSRAFADGRGGGSSGTGLCYSWYGTVLSLSHVSWTLNLTWLAFSWTGPLIFSLVLSAGLSERPNLCSQQPVNNSVLSCSFRFPVLVLWTEFTTFWLILSDSLGGSSSRKYLLISHCFVLLVFPSGKWQEAARHLKKSIEIVETHHGPSSVETGQELFKLAQILFNGWVWFHPLSLPCTTPVCLTQYQGTWRVSHRTQGSLAQALS